MAHAELALRFDANADKVWSLLCGPDLVPVLLATYAEKVELQGGESGTTLVTTLRSGGVVRERIESVDHAERRMKYRVLDAGPMPYADYRGEAHVQPCGAAACVVSFQCNFVPVEMSEAEARAFWINHNTKVMATLKQFVQDG